MRPVILWGAKGQAKVVREALLGTEYTVVAVFDSDPACPPPFADLPLRHGWQGFEDWQAAAGHLSGCLAVVCIGGDRGLARVELQRELARRGFAPLTVVHRRAFVAADAVLQPGCQILAQAAVCSGATLAEACIINTSASVDHDCRLEFGVHIGPGATLAGCVHAEAYSTIYSGAVVMPRLRIGEGAVVGAGAVITHDVPPYTVVAGVPARELRKLPRSGS